MNIFPIKPPGPARSSPRQPADTRSPKVIAITSGKGGVGKTNVTSNLAIALAKNGNRVCIFDADTSLANINVVMGLQVEYTVEHLLAGERTVDEILAEGPEGVMIIPAASGIAECANLDQEQRQRLIAALESLEDRFDYILIDTAAGIGESVLSFVQSAQYAIVVISTEPTSLTDAFALLRVLKRRSYEHPAYVLVNMAINYANSMEVFKRFEAAVKKYLNMKVHYLGYITEDKAIRTSVSAQRPVLLQHPEALASRCFTTLATVLSKQFAGTAQPHSFSAYWNDLAAGPAAATEPAGHGPSAPDWEETPARTWAQAAGLIQDPAIPEEELARELGALLQAYHARFRTLPLAPDRLPELRAAESRTETELRTLVAGLEAVLERRFGPSAPAFETPPTTTPEQDTILLEYRRSAERIQAEETLLHQALNRLYAYINRELLPSGKGSPLLDEHGHDGRDMDEGARHPEPGPDDAPLIN
ncbi:MAG: MinD/ParA family protein [Gammaproteobacteria bacterium]|nr:MinD/ParA family protein [Gammaproteobacteria bacterium]